MSLLTRCPACTTLYKVVPDQLRISQGWVKCGQCGEIFDATQHLMEASTEPEEPAVQPSSELAAESTEDVTGSSLQQTVEEDPVVVQQQDNVAESEFHPETVLETNPDISEHVEVETPAQEALLSPEDAALLPLDSEPAVFSSMPPDSSALIPQTSPDSQPQQEPEPQTQAATEDAAVLTPSFMREAGLGPVWQSRRIDRALLVVCVLLVMGLCCQWVYQDHDRLAASRPQWRPALDRICSVLRCSVSPLQQIESIAIDSAVFNKDEPGRYRLTFALKNTANLMLALPSIELTLTDVQDRVVVRRVIAPPELSATADHLAANADLPVMLNLRLQAEASSPAVVGYRLLAFYP